MSSPGLVVPLSQLSSSWMMCQRDCQFHAMLLSDVSWCFFFHIVGFGRNLCTTRTQRTGSTRIEKNCQLYDLYSNFFQPSLTLETLMFKHSLTFLRLCPSLSSTVLSQDHIKAQKLVSFACWFMRLAEAAGVPCEVAFWIDYCCCEQDSAVRGMMKAVCRLRLRDEHRYLESQLAIAQNPTTRGAN